MATIVASIDLKKIDKTKLKQGKNGALYLDLVLIETPDSKYDDSHMVVQGVSKEDRDAGVRGGILGNAKTYGTNGGGGGRQQAPKQRVPRSDDDELPFD